MNQTTPRLFEPDSRMTDGRNAAPTKYQPPTLVKSAVLSAITSEDGSKGVSNLPSDA